MDSALPRARKGTTGKFSFPLYSLRVGLQRSVPESFFAIVVGGNDMAVAKQLVFVSRQALETHRPARVQLAGADSQLSAQAITKAVSKSGRGILIDASGIYSGH